MTANKKLNIAIIGTGSAGASAALYLDRQGHTITIFEREKDPKPVGAGVMLQPTGLNCLYELGVGDEALKLGSPIHQMMGMTTNGKKVIDLTFDKEKELFGLGIHRGALYFLLFDQLKEKGIDVRLGAEIISIDGKDEKVLKDTQDNEYGPYDLVIVANGSRSALRNGLPIVKVDKTQNYGALWAKIPFNNDRFDNKIIQYYKGSRKMVGFMPIGKPNDEDEEHVNFFWSISMADMDDWKANTTLEEWKDEILTIAPEYDDVLEKLTSKDQVMVAPYMDVELSPSYHEGVVFIGDAAHPMSPQLSQGASFALLDSKILSETLEKHSNDIEKALKKFYEERSKQVSFYQRVSRVITPMFQSDANTSWIRDNVFNAFCHTYPTSEIIKSTIMGYREGIFSNLDKKKFLRKK